MISREEALRLIADSSKRSHAVLTSKIMRALARRLSESEDEWELVGLLHDLDYDVVKGDMNRHGIVASQILKGKLPEIALHAIRAHDYRTGIKPRSLLDKALKAADILTILIEEFQAQNTPITLRTLKHKLDRETPEKPWFRSLTLTRKNLGLTTQELLEIGIEQAH